MSGNYKLEHVNRASVAVYSLGFLGDRRTLTVHHERDEHGRDFLSLGTLDPDEDEDFRSVLVESFPAEALLKALRELGLVEVLE